MTREELTATLLLWRVNLMCFKLRLLMRYRPMGLSKAWVADYCDRHVERLKQLAFEAEQLRAAMMPKEQHRAVEP